jgi:hypothetical protein
MPTVADALARGPEPSRLGFSAARVPHPSGEAAAGLAKAQLFSRPSTAVALGARPVARASTGATFAAGSRPSLLARGAATTVPHRASSGAAPQGPPPQARAATRSAPAFHGSGGMHMGGGHR